MANKLKLNFLWVQILMTIFQDARVKKKGLHFSFLAPDQDQ
jgi:hypothetical protein